MPIGGRIMTLLDQWQAVAFDEKANRNQLQQFWNRYFLLEKGVYAQLLANPEEKVEGTVKELADKYHLELLDMVGFLDGIDESLVNPNPMEELTEDTHVNLVYDPEKLYKNMVDAKATWLYELPEWENIFTQEERAKLYKEQKESGTVRKAPKIYPNDPCPCGSGKKYKYCHGRNR